MKKVCLLAFSLLVFLLCVNISFAKSDLSASSSSQPTATVNYELPYPGLLPDSPLYFLRIIRDRTVGFLISEPKKKAEFELLQADKRLNAGVYLFKKKKFKDTISIISKAENYFDSSLRKVKEAKGQGMETTGITNKLIDSSKKHLEVLKSLEEKSPQDFKSSFNFQLQRVNGFAKEAVSLTLK